jgi:hypothetical protein
MRCARCGKFLASDGDDLVRLAVVDGNPPGPLLWSRSGPWPNLAVCTQCSRAVGTLLATAPLRGWSDSGDPVRPGPLV